MVTCIRDGTDIGSSAPNPVSSLRNFTQILRREVMYSVAGKTYKKNLWKLEKIIMKHLEKKKYKHIVFSDSKVSVL